MIWTMHPDKLRTEIFKAMFLQESDLGATIYEYQIEEITEGDEGITAQAMQAAEEEIRSYLSGNNRKEWSDGRLKYDVNAILSATDTARNALIVRQAVTIAKWYIVDLCNYDVIYEHAKDRYDRAISWLNKLAKGDINLSTLPLLPETPSDNSDDTAPFAYGSRDKFTHE